MRPTSVYASLLRQELCQRNEAYAASHNLTPARSFGAMPVILYEPDLVQSRHGNFTDASYKAILAREKWRRRLKKVHSQASRALPPNEHGWRELDSCMSSDALLMNVFCYPGITQNRALVAMLGIEAGEIPEFGFNAGVPLRSGKGDRTEVDMKLGDLLVESKLTESDFQFKEASVVENYCGLKAVFDHRKLPRIDGMYVSYQLIRNVLAAYALPARFCLLVDQRRPDLVELWFEILQCVQVAELRTRCKILTWQELSTTVPPDLQNFLDAKYGIVRPGRVSIMPNNQD